jgi:ubiquinone biosynthesis protein UbiJ
MLAVPFSRFANHVLGPANWAREKLAAHAGKVARFDVFPATLEVEVTGDGLLRPAAAGAVPDVSVKLDHLTLLEMMAGAENAWRKAAVEGDTAFAAAISQVASNLRWDVEEDLSRVVGDVAAHRMAQAGRTAAAWPRQAARSVAANAAEYLTEETRLLVTPLQATEFSREVDELRDAVERLDKRVGLLARRLGGD